MPSDREIAWALLMLDAERATKDAGYDIPDYAQSAVEHARKIMEKLNGTQENVLQNP